MSDLPVSKLPDADMQAVPAALARAARTAREVAQQTGTGIVIVRDGVVVEERCDDVSETPELRRQHVEGTRAMRGVQMDSPDPE